MQTFPVSRLDRILALVRADREYVRGGNPKNRGQFSKAAGSSAPAAEAPAEPKPAEPKARQRKSAVRATTAPAIKAEPPGKQARKPRAKKAEESKPPAAPKEPKSVTPRKPRATRAKKPETREEYEAAIEDLIAQYESKHGAWGGPKKTRGTQRVTTATGRQVEVRPKVVDLADLVTSDDPRFPQELQPRQRGQRAALSEQVRSIARNLNPAMLGESAESDRGAPITGDGGVVESGNGRVMALKEVYANLPEKAQEYRDWLDSQGYKTAGMKQPVLIRERATPMTMEERRKFTVEANQSSTAALSSLERAQADGKMIDASMLAKLQPGDLASGQNTDFARAFIQQLPEGERNAMQAKDGKLSSEGVRRLQGAILAKAYGGSEEATAVMGRMLESTDDDMRSAMGAMLDAAREMAELRQTVEDGVLDPKYDVAKALPKALERVKKIRENGQDMNEALSQTDAFAAPDPVGDALVRALYDRNGKRLLRREKLAQTLRNYARAAEAERNDQDTMFGSPGLSPAKLIETSRPEEEEQQKSSGDMFGGLAGWGAATAGRKAGTTATVHSDSWGPRATLLQVLLDLNDALLRTP